MATINCNSSKIEAFKSVFGEHPEDVISPIEVATDAFGWLEEIFRTIRDEAAIKNQNFAKNSTFSFRAKTLADAGLYLANNIGEYTGSTHDQFKRMLENLEQN